MEDICIPVPDISGGSNAEITVQLPNNGGEVKYRLEAFICGKESGENESSNEEVFRTLKNFVDNYDKSWELIQLFAPIGKEKNVKVLYKLR